MSTKQNFSDAQINSKNLGKNIQFLRKMHNKMTQEDLAQKLNVSRQTVSKWELDGAYPEINNLLELCQLFSCTMDQLVREDLNTNDPAYSDVRIEQVDGFSYVQHIVISETPEDDALQHMTTWAKNKGILEPQLIGWDFPCLSQEQINVYHMHGYGAACILPEAFRSSESEVKIHAQKSHRYAIITITEPFISPFTLIPNAYKTILRYIEINGYQFDHGKNVLPCFEKVYQKDEVTYMDVYIAV